MAIYSKIAKIIYRLDSLKPIINLIISYCQIKVEFVEIREFILVIIFVISPQNGNKGLNMKTWKFLGIQPKYGSNRRIRFRASGS